MNPSTPCIFCEIVAGRQPASIAYEDDLVVAFPTLRQVRPGELLVIPKAHIDEFCDTPDALAAHITVIANRLARALRSIFKPERMGLIVHGHGVPHAHLIVLPQHDITDIVSGRHARIEDSEIRYGEANLPIWPREKLDALADQIRAALTQDGGA